MLGLVTDKGETDAVKGRLRTGHAQRNELARACVKGQSRAAKGER